MANPYKNLSLIEAVKRAARDAQWTDEDLVRILLEYVSRQHSDEAFYDFLADTAATDVADSMEETRSRLREHWRAAEQTVRDEAQSLVREYLDGATATPGAATLEAFDAGLDTVRAYAAFPVWCDLILELDAILTPPPHTEP